MINLYSSSIYNGHSSTAVSHEAVFIKKNTEYTRDVFVEGSVFVKEMYKRELRVKFDSYTITWLNETMFTSSSSEIFSNNAYRSIIGLGTEVIPLIIEDLKINDYHWFYALESLTGVNPIQKEHRGVIQLMKEDWLNWAEDNIQV
jgi:hypothetical protein